jgi:hypothetical protein
MVKIHGETMQNFLDFQLDKRYEIDLTGHLRFGLIPCKELVNIFSDGRLMGLLSENLIVSIFNTIEHADTKICPYDLLDVVSGQTFEVKSFTKDGVKTSPSGMQGSGRTYDKGEHRRRMQGVDYFIFVDIRNFPIVTLIPIDAKLQELVVRSMCMNKFLKLTARVFGTGNTITVPLNDLSKI